MCDEVPPLKKPKHPKLNEKEVDDDLILSFLKWASSVDLNVSPKAKVVKAGMVARYGMVATSQIEVDECIFEIPRSALLWEETCSISNSLVANKTLESESNWVRLVLSLVYEFTNKDSAFAPYLNFCPDVTCMDQPLFWSEACKNWLQGTGVLEVVERDIKAIEEEYKSVALPFIKEHSHLGFDPKIHTLDLYKHMVAFVMAYSFTDPNDDVCISPVMVPMADVLNHTAKNNAHLQFDETSLKMICVKTILAGEEIYNTYGSLANWQLLQMYGFVEKQPLNVYDTVDVEMKNVYDVLEKLESAFPSLQGKINWLKDEGELPNTSPVTIGLDGILTCGEFKLLMKVLPMSELEFSSFCKDFDGEDWETDSSEDSDSDESDFEVVSFSKISKIPKGIKSFWSEVVTRRLKEFHPDFDNAASTQSLSLGDKLDQWRYDRVNSLISGQKSILRLFLNSVDK